jgi:hypothetical protein
MDPALQRLLDERNCARIVLDTLYHSDRHEYEAMAALYTEDARLYRPGSDEPLQGRQGILDSYRNRPPQRMTCHLIMAQRFDLLPSGHMRAHSVVVMHATERNRPEDPRNGRQLDPRELIGELEDELVHTADGWRVQLRRARFNFYRD